MKKTHIYFSLLVFLLFANIACVEVNIYSGLTDEQTEGSSRRRNTVIEEESEEETEEEIEEEIEEEEEERSGPPTVLEITAFCELAESCEPDEVTANECVQELQQVVTLGGTFCPDALDPLGATIRCSNDSGECGSLFEGEAPEGCELEFVILSAAIESCGFF